MVELLDDQQLVLIKCEINLSQKGIRNKYKTVDYYVYTPVLWFLSTPELALCYLAEHNRINKLRRTFIE